MLESTYVVCPPTRFIFSKIEILKPIFYMFYEYGEGMARRALAGFLAVLS